MANENYLTESIWNAADFTQFFVYIIYQIIKINHGFESEEKHFYVILLQLILVVFGFLKILFFIRIYESYGFLVQMVGLTMIQLVPFTLFFLMWIALFSVCF